MATKKEKHQHCYYLDIVKEAEDRFLTEDEIEQRNKRIANITFPWRDWTLNAEMSPQFFESFKNSTKFVYQSNGVGSKHANPEHGLGIWLPTATDSDGLPMWKPGVLVTLDLENKRFFINEKKTSLVDPRLASVIKSTITLHPEFADFQVSQTEMEDKEVKDDEGFSYWDSFMVINDLGVASDLVASMKTMKGVSPVYTKFIGGDDEDRNAEFYEKFEFEVFQELSEMVWYHATRETNLESIKKHGLLPSGTREQGDGWTQANLHLQNAVYLTRRPDYVSAIAETLAARFKEKAVVLKVSGEILKTNDYSNVAVDEDSLRSELDDMVGSRVGNPDNFTDFHGLPEIIESALHRVASIGYKGKIDPKYIVDVVHVVDPNEDE
jgi:hypothetical protein